MSQPDLKAEGDSLSTEKFAAGKTNLMMAVQERDIAKVKAYIDAGCNVNFQSERFKTTALHCAANAGCPEAVKLLLDAGADKELKNSHSETAGAVAHVVAIGNGNDGDEGEKAGKECELLICGPGGY